VAIEVGMNDGVYGNTEHVMRAKMWRGWFIAGHMSGRPVYHVTAEVSEWIKSQDKKHWQPFYEDYTDAHFQFTDEFTTMFLLRWT